MLLIIALFTSSFYHPEVDTLNDFTKKLWRCDSNLILLVKAVEQYPEDTYENIVHKAVLLARINIYKERINTSRAYLSHLIDLVKLYWIVYDVRDKYLIALKVNMSTIIVLVDNLSTGLNLKKLVKNEDDEAFRYTMSVLKNVVYEMQEYIKRLSNKFADRTEKLQQQYYPDE